MCLMGCCRDLGEMLGGADGASWLLCICPEITGGSRLCSTWGDYLGAKMDRDGWAGDAQKLRNIGKEMEVEPYAPCLAVCAGLPPQIPAPGKLPKPSFAPGPTTSCDQTAIAQILAAAAPCTLLFLLVQPICGACQARSRCACAQRALPCAIGEPCSECPGRGKDSRTAQGGSYDHFQCHLFFRENIFFLDIHMLGFSFFFF